MCIAGCMTHAFLVALLVAVIFVTVIYSTIQVLPLVGIDLLSAMAGVEDALAFVGITLPVQIMAAVALVPSLAYQLYCLYRLANPRAAARLIKRKMRKIESGSRNTSSIYRRFRYVIGSQSPYYIWLKFGGEVSEMAFQALELYEESEAGVGPGGLAPFATVLLANALALPTLALMTRRRVQQDRKVLSKWLGAVGLFDSLCNFWYGVFPLVYFFTQYMWYATSIKGVDDECKEIALVNHSCFAARSGNVVAFARVAFFGAPSPWLIFLKLKTRVWPLFSLPRQLTNVFVHRRAWRGVGRVPRWRGRMRGAGSYEPEEGKDAPRRNRCQSHSGALCTAAINACAPRSPHREMLYKPVPLFATILPALAVLSICLFAIVRLASFPVCPVPEMRESCTRRTFNIFSLSSGSTVPGCACLVFIRVDSDVWCGGSNGTMTTADPRSNQTTSAFLRETGPSNFLAIAFAKGCKDDEELFETLAQRMGNSALFVLSRSRISNVDFLKKSDNPLAELQQLDLDDNDLGDLDPSEIGESLMSLEHLNVLSMRRQSLTVIPASVGRLSRLTRLYLYNNSLRGLPMEQLTATMENLHFLLLQNNQLTSFDLSSAAQLPELERLNLGSNRLSVLPAGLMGRRNIKVLDLNSNTLDTSWLPSAAEAPAVPDVNWYERARVMILNGNPGCTNRSLAAPFAGSTRSYPAEAGGDGDNKHDYTVLCAGDVYRRRVYISSFGPKHCYIKCRCAGSGLIYQVASDGGDGAGCIGGTVEGECARPRIPDRFHFYVVECGVVQ